MAFALVFGGQGHIVGKDVGEIVVWTGRCHEGLPLELDGRDGEDVDVAVHDAVAVGGDDVAYMLFLGEQETCHSPKYPTPCTFGAEPEKFSHRTP